MTCCCGSEKPCGMKKKKKGKEKKKNIHVGFLSPRRERANHQGWDEGEEGPVNQNEWAPLRALVWTRPQRIPPSSSSSSLWEHGALGVKRDPDALLHMSPQQAPDRPTADIPSFTSCLLIFPTSRRQQVSITDTNTGFLFLVSTSYQWHGLLCQS